MSLSKAKRLRKLTVPRKGVVTTAKKLERSGWDIGNTTVAHNGNLLYTNQVGNRIAVFNPKTGTFRRTSYFKDAGGIKYGVGTWLPLQKAGYLRGRDYAKKHRLNIR